MTSTDLAPAKPLTIRQLAAQKASKPGKVTGKLKVAIDHLVFTGAKTDYQAAAQHAGLTTHAVRSALQRPHVKAYYQQQLDVLLSSERARNIHRRIEIRDAADNMPAVQAARDLDALATGEIGQHSRGIGPQSPGFVIVVQGNAQVRTIEAESVGRNVGSEE